MPNNENVTHEPLPEYGTHRVSDTATEYKIGSEAPFIVDHGKPLTPEEAGMLDFIAQHFTGYERALFDKARENAVRANSERLEDEEYEGRFHDGFERARRLREYLTQGRITGPDLR